RRRMCWALSAIGRAITSAWAAGRSTATNRPPGASLKNTRCAAKSTPGSGSKGNPSSSSPWLVDVSTIRQHRTIWQEHSAKDFASYESYKRAGILYVFPPFITARMGQKIGRRPQTQLCGDAHNKSRKKGR